MRPGSSVAGVADPGRGAERLAERFFGMGPAAKKRIRSRVLRDVAEGQVWKPGPAYPATVAALPPAPRFRIRIFCSRGSLTPVVAPNASPNVFLAWGRLRRSGFGVVS